MSSPITKSRKGGAPGTQENLSVTAAANNQLSATGFAYDAAGNMTGDGAYTYGFNAESEIKSAAGVNYTYDGDGNRVQKSSGTIYWYGAGSEILSESDASGNFKSEFIYFGGKRIARYDDPTGNIFYYMEDMLGSSRTILQSGSGQTVPCYDADLYPYGGERAVTNTCPQNFKFEGKERDTETSNDDFGARYYSSRLGRWLSADWSSVPAPVPYANLTNPQTLNLYAMVRDNPETFADLDGHFGSAGQASVDFQVNAMLQADEEQQEEAYNERNNTWITVPASGNAPADPAQNQEKQEKKEQEPTAQDKKSDAKVGLAGAVGVAAASGSELGPADALVVAGAVGYYLYKNKDEAKKAWTKFETAVEHLGKLAGPDQDPRKGWKDTVRRVADDMDNHANRMTGHENTAKAIHVAADFLRGMIPSD